ncbi:MAG: hypothetical protein JWL70_2573 [Acidimicrobiia bacterium]|nr:hypothetical protein [Acidimicrobiia bacterium]
MAISIERRSELCDTCGAVAAIEYVAVLQADTVDRVDIGALCPNLACGTRQRS